MASKQKRPRQSCWMLDVREAGIRQSLADPDPWTLTLIFRPDRSPPAEWLLCLPAADPDGGRRVVLMPKDDPTPARAQAIAVQRRRWGDPHAFEALCPACGKGFDRLFAIPGKGRFACGGCHDLDWKRGPLSDFRVRKARNAIEGLDEKGLKWIARRIARGGASGGVASRSLLRAIATMEEEKQHAEDEKLARSRTRMPRLHANLRLLRTLVAKAPPEATALLSPMERKALAYRVGLGDEKPMATREIAERMGLPIHKARRIQRRGVEKLWRFAGCPSLRRWGVCYRNR